MWNPFRSQPTCPVDPETREWIDGRFRWLQEQFGHDTPARVPVVLPTPEFFPDAFNGAPDDAHTMLRRVAGYMDVDPDTLELVLFSESDPASFARLGGITMGAAGLYLRGTRRHGHDNNMPPGPGAIIGIETGLLTEPEALVATLAHEIGHELLLGRERVTEDQQDHEPLTDLLTVFLGVGIFTANSTIRDRGWSSGIWAGWTTRRHGYLDQRSFAYALARFAHARGESKPDWSRHVRPDVRVPMREAIRYLSATAE